jgi:ankyrin repeat protein
MGPPPGRGCSHALLTVTCVIGAVFAVVGVGCVLLIAGLDDLQLGFSDCTESGDRLIEAAADGDAAKVDELLDDGADPDVEVDGETPLTCAAAKWRVGIVTALLDAGATASPEALRSAVGARSGFAGLPATDVPADVPRRDQVVTLLLERGADPNAGTEGPSPLLYAAWSGQATTVDLLLAHGADANHGGRVMSAVVTIAQGFNRANGADGEVTVPSRLSPRGDEVANVPPLIGAVWGQNGDIALVLLDAGADPNLVSDEAFSPIMAAALLGDRPMVELLLAHGASPTPTVREGVPTPAEAARDAGHDDIAALLVPR